MLAKRELRRLSALFLPPNCLACDTIVERQGAVCARCWVDIEFIEKPFCNVLGVPFSYSMGDGALSAEAIANPPPFDRLRAVALYRGTARQLVTSLKFADRADLAPWMADWIVRSSDGVLSGRPVLVPVPLHRYRLFSRRYNQSAELARHVCNRSSARYKPHVLHRVKATRQQVGLGTRERLRNVSGAFRVPAEQRIEVDGQRVVLVDDVYTTGATLAACARALRRAGASQIDCLTFARVASGDQ